MSKLKKILIGMIVLALLITISFVGTVFWLQSKSDSDSKNKDKKHVEEVETAVHAMENPILSNLKNSNKKIRVKVELEIRNETEKDKKFIEELHENDGKVTTMILTVLRNKTEKEVTKPNSPLTIRKEITDKLNETYHTDRFVATNFIEFITQ